MKVDPWPQEDREFHQFTWGYQNVPNDHGEILDIGLAVLEEIVCFEEPT